MVGKASAATKLAARSQRKHIPDRSVDLFYGQIRAERKTGSRRATERRLTIDKF